MSSIAELPKYEKYKETPLDWLGEIPNGWELVSLKHLLSFHTGGTPPSGDMQFYDGDLPWITIADLNGRYTSNCHYLSRLGVRKARIPLTPKGSLLYSFKLSIGQVSFASSDVYTNEAIASFVPIEGLNLRYYFYALPIFLENNAATNIYGAKLLNQDLIKNSLVLKVCPAEQDVIAKFLDKKTTQIDEAIGIKEKQIALLKERKQIIIQKAVTQGLDPNVTMRDSGVDWIGEIPAHWEVRRAKYLFDEIDERSISGDEELLSVSHMTGVTPRSEKNVSMFMAEDYSGSKLCRKGDLVINIMWAWMGALGVSDYVGIVSPSYGVFRQKEKNTFNSTYLEYLLKSNFYIEYYNRVSTGLHSSRLRFYGHMLFAMEMGYPSYEEQNEIIDYLDEQTNRIDLAVSSEVEQIEKLKEYKSTLINSAVTGKIKITPDMVGA